MTFDLLKPLFCVFQQHHARFIPIWRPTDILKNCTFTRILRDEICFLFSASRSGPDVSSGRASGGGKEESQFLQGFQNTGLEHRVRAFHFSFSPLFLKFKCVCGGEGGENSLKAKPPKCSMILPHAMSVPSQPQGAYKIACQVKEVSSGALLFEQKDETFVWFS